MSQVWPGLKDDDLIFTYVSDLDRMVTLFTNQTFEYKGITMRRFMVPDIGMQNSTIFPQNALYYQFGKAGVSNLTSCRGGAPIFMSKPHFLGADPFYFARLEGLNPDPELHNTHVDIEPTLGTEMHAEKRLQVNVRISTEPLLYPNVSDDFYVPVVWIEQSGHLTDPQAAEFKGKIYFTQALIKYLRIFGILVGAVVLVASAFLVVKTHKMRGKREYDEIVDPGRIQ